MAKQPFDDFTGKVLVSGGSVVYKNGFLAKGDAMTENEFLLQDRITKIKSMDEKYNLRENAYISFSGGKDSTVLSAIIDFALPGNEIPRVYANTGIELTMILAFVKGKAEKDKRFIILKPSNVITNVLKEHGYPFKSKMHSNWLKRYQKNGMNLATHNYLQDSEAQKTLFRPCPKVLKYQFSPDFKLKISDECCYYLKEKPLTDYAKENGKTIYIDGIMKAEGGRRTLSKCVVMSGKKVKSFHPLLVISEQFEEWFINEYNVDICDIYYPPYNYKRTGCKGCPFSTDLQKELDTLEKFFSGEKKQCEKIWKPVYDEYRRIGYRLKPKGLFD